MYLVAIGWIYVALMMGIVEATNDNGTVLGGIITFVLYGVLPTSLVMYLMGTPMRRKAIKARERTAWEQMQAEQVRLAEQAANNQSSQPDAGSHPPGTAETGSVTPVRKEP